MTNPSLAKNYIKIGATRRDPQERADELSAETAIPESFKVYKSWQSSRIFHAEKVIHAKLNKYRVNEKREFFSIWPPYAILQIWWLKLRGKL